MYYAEEGVGSEEMESVGHLLRFGFEEETDRIVTGSRIKEIMFLSLVSILEFPNQNLTFFFFSFPCSPFVRSCRVPSTVALAEEATLGVMDSHGTSTCLSPAPKQSRHSCVGTLRYKSWFASCIFLLQALRIFS